MSFYNADCKNNKSDGFGSIFEVFPQTFVSFLYFVTFVLYTRKRNQMIKDYDH